MVLCKIWDRSNYSTIEMNEERMKAKQIQKRRSNLERLFDLMTRVGPVMDNLSLTEWKKFCKDVKIHTV